MKHEREQISKAADRMRDDLMLTLRELDRRKDESLNFQLQLKRHWHLVQIATVGAGLLAAGGVGLAMYKHTQRRRHLRVSKNRLIALGRAWQHPERLASRAPDAPTGMLLIRRVGLAMLVVVARQLAQRALTAPLARASLPGAV